MARVTGLEPATSGVTGRHSNRLSYTRILESVRMKDIRPERPQPFDERLTTGFGFGCQAGFKTKE